MRKPHLFTLSWVGGLAFLCAALCCHAGTFKVRNGVEKGPEDNTYQTMVIQTDTDELSFTPPWGFTVKVFENEQRIDFKSPDGQTACSIGLTNTFAGVVPDDEQLKKQAEVLYPGSSVLQTGPVIAPCGNGRYVDVLRVFQNGGRLTTRHAYCPLRDQTIEVVYSVDSQKFEKKRRDIAALIGTLKVQPVQTSVLLPEAPKP